MSQVEALRSENSQSSGQPCSGRTLEEQSIIDHLRVSVTQERLKPQSLEMDVSAESEIFSELSKELEACEKDQNPQKGLERSIVLR